MKNLTLGAKLGTFPKKRLFLDRRFTSFACFFGFSENFAKSHERVAADTLPTV